MNTTHDTPLYIKIKDETGRLVALIPKTNEDAASIAEKMADADEMLKALAGLCGSPLVRGVVAQKGAGSAELQAIAAIADALIAKHAKKD